MYVVINKVSEPWGELGNMAPFRILYEGQYWPRAENLFQALRLREEATGLREEIRGIKNPMAAKMRAKRIFRENPGMMAPGGLLGDTDVARMKMVLRLKLHQHALIQVKLRSTDALEIVEDATRRQRGSGLFWGAALQDDGSWSGQNELGNLWMVLRRELKSWTP